MPGDSSDLDRLIGAALREARLSRACTQAELAERLNVGRSALAHYEAGKRPLTVSMLLQVAQVLQYPPSRLLPSILGDGPVPAARRALPEEVAQVARLLSDRPDLVPSVLDLLEALLQHQVVADDDDTQRPAVK
jgi:transcriptional regulator with XRE-family HTH domain